MGDLAGVPSAAGGCGWGGLASTPTAPSEGPRDKTLHGARALEGFVPAQGGHTQLQACKGKSPMVSHLKIRNLEK